jgi:hypothetical protein
VFENGALRRIFGPKRDEVTGEWRKPHNDELNCTPHPLLWGDKTEKNQMRRACGAYGEGRGVYRVLMGKPEGKIHSGDPGVDGRKILRWIYGSSGSGM